MKKARPRITKKQNPLFFVFKAIGSEWIFQFRIRERSANHVRMYLAENGYEGRYRWKTEKGRIWHGTSLIR